MYSFQKSKQEHTGTRFHHSFHHEMTFLFIVKVAAGVC